MNLRTLEPFKPFWRANIKFSNLPPRRQALKLLQLIPSIKINPMNFINHLNLRTFEPFKPSNLSNFFTLQPLSLPTPDILFLILLKLCVAIWI